MGIFGMRNPVKRAILEKAHLQRPQAILLASIKDESTYYSLMEPMKSTGIIKKIVPYQKAREQILGGKIRIQIDPDKIIMEMIHLTSYLVDLLGQRYWTLVETQDSEFFSSNHPLNIVNSDEASHEPYFELKNNIITFPISSQFALIGTSSKILAPQIIDTSTVEAINCCTAYNGSTKLFASREIALPEKSAVIALKNFHNMFAS